MSVKRVNNLYRASEDDEQAAVIEFCDLFGIDVIHVPNEGKRSPATAAKLKRLGLRPGVPDLFFPIPSGEYHGLFIEMKVLGGRPTPDQKQWIAKLSAKGYRAVVCVGADAAICEIKNYIGEGRKREIREHL